MGARLWGGMALLLVTGTGDAETLLYDPEPPADSAYVRVMAMPTGASMLVQVDGQAHGARLERGVPGDYMVVPAGKHAITLSASGQREVKYAATLDVSAGRAMTVVFVSENVRAQPLLFEDRANANKLKALLAVYQLDAKSGPLDIRSADGKVSVLTGLAPGTMRTVMVNPVKITLAAFRDAHSLVTMPLDMAPGGTYSIILSAAPHDGVQAQVLQNKVERYTGR